MPVHIENSWRDEVELGGKDGGKKRREACERKKNEKARKEGGFEPISIKHVCREDDFTHPLTLILTGKARAIPEVHALHAHGKAQLPDVSCKKEDKRGARR